MKVFDRGKEIMGEERMKEMEELMWFRELLSIEEGFGFGEDGGESEEEVDWSKIDNREVGNYWELNDGVGKEYGLSGSRRLKKNKLGCWDEKRVGKWGKVEWVRVHEEWDGNDVCKCVDRK